jgi:hypothetical protein
MTNPDRLRPEAELKKTIGEMLNPVKEVRMLQITQTEAWYLGEAIKGETLMCQKMAAYLNQIQDPQLRNIVTDLQRTCLKHVEILSNQVK